MNYQLLKALKAAVLLMVLCLGFNPPAVAQEETAAKITGTVVDSTGGVVPNATVIISSAATGYERRVPTNEDGNYAITPIPPGDYTITVEQSGFKRYVVNITLFARDRRPVDITLEPGLSTETVTVVDDPPLIQETATGQGVISGKQVIELPLNNRDFFRLTELIPGVSSSLDDETSFGLTSRLDISVNGIRRNSNNILVDGATNVDPGSNITALSTPTVDSIQEFKVLTSNYTAEFGRSAGGVVTIVTRGGTNRFSGSIYEFWRHEQFNANTFFNNAQGRRPDGSPRAAVPILRYHNFGGTFSGPIYLPRFGEGGPTLYNGKDRTFFFFSQEFRRVRRGLSDVQLTVPNAADRIGDFNARLGNVLCRNSAGAVSASTSRDTCPTGATNVTAVDTTGATINVRQNQIFRPGTEIAYAGNRLPFAELDPRALALQRAFPDPNFGTNGFLATRVNLNNTQQSTGRIDHNINDSNKIFGRFTFDSTYTQEPGGLFTALALPNIATTDTNVPGRTLAVSLTSTLSPQITNEAAFNYSGAVIDSALVGRGRRSDYPGSETIPERFPENANGAIPSISISTFGASLASTQGYNIRTRILSGRDVFTWIRGNHAFKFGGEVSFEKKAENANNATQGIFSFVGTQTAGPANLGGAALTGLGSASFLLGRAATYTEDQFDVTFDFRFGRREFFAQDSWRALPNLTIDYGFRYQFFTPIRENNNVLTAFNPELYRANLAPTCANAACTVLVAGTGNALNGISVAGVNAPRGNIIQPADYNNFSPRVGIAYGLDSKTIFRVGYGLYYDQVLTGIFGQNTQVNPPFNNRLTFTSTGTSFVTLADPTAGAPGATAPRAAFGTDPNLRTPEVQQWSLGIQREVFRNAVADVSYVGTKGDFLVRPVDINTVAPSRVLAAGGSGTVALINALRPYQGFSTINYRESSGKSRYHGLLSSFRYRFTTGSEVSLSYTFSKNLTNASNDRDAVDLPQDYSLKDQEFAEARTNRRHVFAASYVYELPFFRTSGNALARVALGGWQLSGITQIQSGLPIARVTIANTINGTRGLYPNLIGDPTGGLTGTPDATGLPFLFDPTVFVDPGSGQFGNSPRSFARLPYQNQTNLSAVKNIYFDKENRVRLQLRGEVFNVFNRTQFTAVGTTFNSAVGLNAQTIGRPIAARLPREFQFAARLQF